MSEPPVRFHVAMVYFIQDEDGYIKIGSANDPLGRLRDLQIGSRQRLTLLAIIGGGRTVEKALHLYFAAVVRRENGSGPPQNSCDSSARHRSI